MLKTDQNPLLVIQRRAADQESVQIANLSARVVQVTVRADALSDLHNGIRLLDLLAETAPATVRDDAIRVPMPAFGLRLLTQAQAVTPVCGSFEGRVIVERNNGRRGAGNAV